MEPDTRNHDKVGLERLAEDACARFGLKRLYFAESVGRRMHFLAGFGSPGVDMADKMPIGNTIVVFALPGDNTPGDYRERLMPWLADRLFQPHR